MQSSSTIFDFETRTIHPRASEATLAGREHHGGMPSVITLVPPVPDEPPKDADDPFKIQLDERDPEHPRNMPVGKKWYLTMLAGMLVLNTTFASSAPSGAIGPISEKFGLSEIVGTLMISLFVMGYTFGPLLWGPLSETYGRRPIFVIPFALYTMMQVGNALAPNTAALLIFRFLGGFFAAAPLTNAGAILGDLWAPETRGKALSFFALGPFAGPTIAPLISGFMTVAGVSWRWVFGVLAIFAGTCTILVFFTVPETYEPRLSAYAAERRRRETGDNRYYAPIERRNISFSQRVSNILAKPFKVLFSEPMLIAITIYQSFIFGCLYLLFGAYPVVFSQGHNLNPGITGLMYLPVTIGAFGGCFSYILYWNPRYVRHAARFAPDPVPPEYRLEMAVWGALPYAIAFFWFGWTSFPSISVWAPMSQGVIMGWSLVWLFLSQLNYIIDTYLSVAATALAANTVIRSLFGAGFPLFAHQMYEGLNPRWASTVLGGFALLCVPIPIVLMKFGPTIRAKSRYSQKKPGPQFVTEKQKGLNV